MSTQSAGSKTAENCDFRVPQEQNIAGFKAEHLPLAPQSHRSEVIGTSIDDLAGPAHIAALQFVRGRLKAKYVEEMPVSAVIWGAVAGYAVAIGELLTLMEPGSTSFEEQLSAIVSQIKLSNAEAVKCGLPLNVGQFR